MHRRTATIAISLALAGCGGGGKDDGDEHDPPNNPPAPAPDTRLAVDLYGDSIVSGYGIEVSPAQRVAQARPQWNVLDHSEYGVKLSDLLPNLPYLPRTAPFVVLALGLNDASAADDQFEQNLRQAIELVLQQGRTPVLTGLVGEPNPTPRMLQYNAITLQLAAQYHLEHAHWQEDYRPGDASPDGIHRTQEASDRLAALLVQALDRAMARGRKPP